VNHFSQSGVSRRPHFSAFLSDDYDAAAGGDDAADLGDGALDIDGVFEGFGGVSGVESAIAERQVGEGTGARLDGGRGEPEHGLGEIQPGDLGTRMALGEHAGEPALAAAGVENALPGQVAEELQDQLDVVDARVDGGGEMLLVARGLLEGVADPPAQIRAQGLGLFLPPKEVHARVRKMGRPVLFE